MDYLIRFGIVVSVFLIIGDLLRPKFCRPVWRGASVALATLSLTIWKEGSAYVAIEGRSML